MQDPISEERYESNIKGFKRWGYNELPYGLPLLYAAAGFVTISTILLVGTQTTRLLFGWGIPLWAYALIPSIGLFWAFGGWQHGEEAEEDMSTDSLLNQY